MRLLESVARTATFQRSATRRRGWTCLLEAEGGYWDGVWVLGLTDDVLPASPNPLLPLAVLRQARAPRATPNANANGPKAGRAVRAEMIIVSHAHMDGERELRPSPLIAGAAPLDWTPAPGGGEPLPQESLDEAPAAAGAGRPWRRRSGRARHAGAQPLWAFVRHRLGGRAMAAYADVAAISARTVPASRAGTGLGHAA